MTKPLKVTESLDLTMIIPVGGRNPSTHTLKSWFTGDLIKKIKFVFVFDDLNPFTLESFKEVINQQEANNVKTLVASCRNPGGARNLGLQEAETAWVCFCDSDDLPDLRNICDVLTSNLANDSDVIRGRYGIIREGIEEPPRRFEENKHISNYSDLISFGPGIWRYLFRTELIRDKKFPELSLAEDQIFLMQTFWSSPRIEQSDLNFYTYYLGNPDALTSNRRNLGDLVQVFSLGRIGFSYAKTENQKNLSSIVMARALITSRSDLKTLIRIVFDLVSKVSFSNKIKILAFVKLQLSRRKLDNNEE